MTASGFGAAVAPHDRRPIVVAGNLSLDDTVTPAGSWPAAPGGDSLYAALGARVWGWPAAILTRVGEDYPADHLARFRAFGIATSLVIPAPGPTVHYRVTYPIGGERTFEHLTPPERLAELSPGADDLALVRDAGWLHVAAMPIEHQALAVARGRELGIGVSLDPHEEYVAGHRTTLGGLIGGSVFLPSELEVGLLFPDLAAALDGLALARGAARRLERMGARLVAVKLGVQGSLIRAGGLERHLPALDVRVVDPTGAGDAYCGGFIAGLLATGSPLAATACGTISAALVIGDFGALHLAWPPDRARLRAGWRGLLAGRFGDAGDRALAALEGAALFDEPGASSPSAGAARRSAP